MKSKFIAAIGLGACAACCAGAIALPWAIGVGVLGLAGGSAVAIGASLEILALITAVIGAAGIAGYLFQRRKAKAKTCATDGSCGCRPS
jgi:hypothetical protein